MTAAAMVMAAETALVMAMVTSMITMAMPKPTTVH